MVIVGSVIFILIVTMLHVVGKVRTKCLCSIVESVVATTCMAHRCTSSRTGEHADHKMIAAEQNQPFSPPEGQSGESSAGFSAERSFPAATLKITSTPCCILLHNRIEPFPLLCLNIQGLAAGVAVVS